MYATSASIAAPSSAGSRRSHEASLIKIYIRVYTYILLIYKIILDYWIVGFPDVWVDPKVPYWIGLADDRGEIMYTFIDGNVMSFENFYRFPSSGADLMCVKEYKSSQASIGYTYMWVQTSCNSDPLHLICKRPSGDVIIKRKMHHI